jgi:hypothetical protein
LSVAIDRTRTLRGALCGAVAAAIWAVQQPLDKLIFRSGYDDVELLGRALTSGASWYSLGLAAHLSNGAVFGAVYANIAPSLPISPALRGPALAFGEHLGLWPLVVVTDRLHPARAQLPPLSGNRRAFWQAGYRHLFFGFVLGELERRMNGPPRPPTSDAAADYSSNGHGRIEHAMSVSTSGPSGSGGGSQAN